MKVVAQIGTSPNAPFPFWVHASCCSLFWTVALRGLHKPCLIHVSVFPGQHASLIILKIFTYLSWITVYPKLLASFTTPIYRSPIDALGQALLYLLFLLLLSWLQSPLPCIMFLHLWTTLFRSSVLFLFLPVLPSSLETLQFLLF